MSPAIKYPLSIAMLLRLSILPVTAQTFEQRWGLVPKAHAAEPPAAQKAQPQPNTPAPPPNETGAGPAPAGPAPSFQDHALENKQSVGRGSERARQKPHRVLTGKASFYAYRHGITASGAPFKRDGLTAASRTLPLGTRLRVTDLKTSKSVEVTVTDRGPASKRVMLDLSLGAARALGMNTRGIVQVRAEIIG
jgi:rare lipoprotein A (peptidoglycan hydrolase)